MKSLVAFLVVIFAVAGCSTISSATPTPFSSATATPVCPGAPVIASFAASPNIMTVGGSSTLSWSAVSNATRVTIEPDIGSVTAPGSTIVTPTTTTTYILTATGCGDTVTKQVQVIVNPAFPFAVKAFQGPKNPDNPNQVKVWVHAQAAKPMASIEISVSTPAGLDAFVCVNAAACDDILGYRDFGFSFTYWGKVTDAGVTTETPRYTFTVTK